jgi:iron-sulfur cluster insertion protein
MRRFHCLGFACCVSAAAFLLGCNESTNPEPSRPSLPAPSASKKPFAGQDESPLVTVTPKAAATIRQLVADQPTTEKLYLRVRVVPGGCQGFTHKLDLDPDVSSEDHVFVSAGVSVVAFKRQVEMLRGAQVDFGEKNGKQGFKIDNPNFKGEAARKWLALLEREKDVK